MLMLFKAGLRTVLLVLLQNVLVGTVCSVHMQASYEERKPVLLQMSFHGPAAPGLLPFPMCNILLQATSHGLVMTLAEEKEHRTLHSLRVSF